MTEITITKDAAHAKDIHTVLASAFAPYRRLYTKEAYEATVVSEERMHQRINADDTDVFIALAGNTVAGTCSVKKKGNDLYLFSMGVHPDFKGLGAGRKMLQAVENKAKAYNCNRIILETYRCLEAAISLYDRCGYARTGKQRDYYGIEIFEMEKVL